MNWSRRAKKCTNILMRLLECSSLMESSYVLRCCRTSCSKRCLITTLVSRRLRSKYLELRARATWSWSSRSDSRKCRRIGSTSQSSPHFCAQSHVLRREISSTEQALTKNGSNLKVLSWCKNEWLKCRWRSSSSLRCTTLCCRRRSSLTRVNRLRTSQGILWPWSTTTSKNT